MARPLRRRAWQPTDEIFDFMGVRWNVSHAWELVGARAPNARCAISPNLAFWLPDPADPEEKETISLVRIDTRYALSDRIDLTRPVLMIAPRGAVLLLDGWHRCFRALHDGLAWLPAHMLSDSEEKRVRWR